MEEQNRGSRRGGSRVEEIRENRHRGGGRGHFQIYSPIAEMTDQQWKDVFDVNLTGTANTIRVVVAHMIPRKSGRIISSHPGRAGTG